MWLITETMDNICFINIFNWSTALVSKPKRSRDEVLMCVESCLLPVAVFKSWKNLGHSFLFTPLKANGFCLWKWNTGVELSPRGCNSLFLFQMPFLKSRGLAPEYKWHFLFIGFYNVKEQSKDEAEGRLAFSKGLIWGGSIMSTEHRNEWKQMSFNFCSVN